MCKQGIRARHDANSCIDDGPRARAHRGPLPRATTPGWDHGGGGSGPGGRRQPAGRRERGSAHWRRPGGPLLPVVLNTVSCVRAGHECRCIPCVISHPHRAPFTHRWPRFIQKAPCCQCCHICMLHVTSPRDYAGRVIYRTCVGRRTPPGCPCRQGLPSTAAAAAAACGRQTRWRLEGGKLNHTYHGGGANEGAQGCGRIYIFQCSGAWQLLAAGSWWLRAGPDSARTR